MSLQPQSDYIATLVHEAQTDPSLFSKIDVDKLMGEIEHINCDYLIDVTSDMIAERIFATVSSVIPSTTDTSDMCTKLSGYRYVGEIYQLHTGKFVRWISATGKLMHGGIVVDIQFTDKQVNVLCKTMLGRFITYNFNETITFQKLSVDEKLILFVNDHIMLNPQHT